MFLACTGLRWGEAMGLRVKHVDLRRRRVSVEENTVEVGSAIQVGTPKTHEKRQVPYPPFLADTMARLVTGRGHDRLLFGDGTSHLRRPKSTSGWFKWSRHAGAGLHRTSDRRRLAAGETPPPTFPRVTPHALRHTAASLAISAGARVKAVQRMLGHASAVMTLDTYADLNLVSEALGSAAASSDVIEVLSHREAFDNARDNILRSSLPGNRVQMLSKCCHTAIRGVSPRL